MGACHKYISGFCCSFRMSWIDEEVITIHGRCWFCLYNRTKWGKYDIETYVLSDSAYFYFFAAEPYAGKVGNQPKDHNSRPEVAKLF